MMQIVEPDVSDKRIFIRPGESLKRMEASGGFDADNGELAKRESIAMRIRKFIKKLKSKEALR